MLIMMRIFSYLFDIITYLDYFVQNEQEPHCILIPQVEDKVDNAMFLAGYVKQLSEGLEDLER